MRLAHHTALKLTLALGSMLPAAAFAGGLGERFSLARGVPADCWLYIHSVRNPERVWIDQQWDRVFDALRNSGIDKDLVTMFISAIPETERDQTKATIDKVVALVNGVRWGKLAENEFVFAERFAPSALWIDYIFIVRGDAESAEANFAGLVAILKEASAAAGATVNQSTLHDVDVWELSQEVMNKLGMSIGLFRSGDTIGLTTSRKALEEIIGLLRGKSDSKSIVASPRFQEALALVPAPEDSITFFDMHNFIGAFGKMFESMVAMKSDKQGNGEKVNPDDIKELGILKKILAQVDVFDYVMTTVVTKGHQEFRHEVSRIQNGKEKTPLASAFLNRKPFDKFDQYIPADATGFKLTGLIDLGLIYDAVLDFVKKEIPDGAASIEKYNATLAAFGFDPKTDFFDWWSGEMISVTMPPAVVTPMGGSDWAWMVRVKDASLARSKIDAFINFVKGKMQAEGQMLMISPAKLDVEGFQEVTHPSVAMFFKPVIGVHGDWLMIGSSSPALGKCLDVASGKSPSVVKNARFAEEGLIPKGPVQSASFKDTSKFGQELGAAAGMIGMFGGMAVAGMPETNDDERQGKRLVQSLLGTLMKLGPVLQKIDFYSSESSIGTYDGKLTMRTESVVTYKKPRESDAKTAEVPKTGD